MIPTPPAATAVVMKFGGTSVQDASRMRAVARHIRDRRAGGIGVIAVVSAMGATTDDLLALARAVSGDPDPRELDRLMATGEGAAASLLALALDALHVPARSFSGAAAGIATTEHHGRARILSIDPTPLRAAVESGWVPIVTGFQGGRADGELTTLGRGGSDTSAVALAAAHGLPCEIYTDVPGVLAADPRLEPAAGHRPFVTHAVLAEMSAHGSGVVARRAIELACVHDVPVQVRSSMTWRPGTVVGHAAAPLETPSVIAVSADRSAVAVRIEGSTADPAGLAEALDELGRAEVPVIVVPGVATDTFAEITVLVSCSDVTAAVDVLGGIARRRGGRVTWDSEHSLVAVTGIGLTAHPGVVATIARAVGRISPRARLLTAAPSSTSWLVPAGATGEVVRALCADLGLRSEHPHHTLEPERSRRERHGSAAPGPRPDSAADQAFAAG